MTKPAKRNKPFAWSKSVVRSKGGIVRVLEDLATLIEASEVGYRTMLIHSYVQCYGLAQYLPTDRIRWRELCGDDEAELALVEKGTPVDALPQVVKRAFKPKSRIATQRVSKICIALSPLLREGLAAADLANRIKKDGGITKMAKAQANGGVGSSDDDAENNDEHDADLDDDDAVADENIDPFCLAFVPRGEASKLLKLRNCRVSMIFDFKKADENTSFVEVVSLEKVSK